MSRRTRFLTSTLCVLVTGAVAATFVLASGDPGAGASKVKKARGFTPGKIAGKWTGTWRNTTFGSEGSIRANVQAKPRGKMLLLADFGGFVFGCPDPPAAPVTLSKGRGKNSWNANGFRFSRRQTQAFGELTIVYNFRSKSFKGSGSAPPCNPDIAYTIDGKLTPSSFGATVEIDLGAGQHATSELSAKKRR
jgi:hypothetical protein